MEVFALYVAIDLLAVVISVHWYAYVLRMENYHLLRSALELRGKGHRKKGRPN